jgi:hypothetical protein
MKVTKHNVRDLIESYLKDNRIKYSTDLEDSKGLTYELYVGSLECYLQVEYDLDDENDEFIIVQLFTEIDKDGNSLYHQDWDNEGEEIDGLNGEIETLIQETKRVNSLVNKIHNKIEQIQEICDDNDFNIEEFITINYNFDK